MGCDIHPHVERRVNGKWERVPYAPEEISRRNYDTFAILGNVRNGRGFAGVVTGSGLPYISDSRGLPPDMAKPLTLGMPYHSEYFESQDWSNDDLADLRGDYGDHSQSWVTLAELEAYDWAHEITEIGILSRAEYDAWDKTSWPKQCCGGIAGPGVVVGAANQPSVTHIQVEWKTTCAEAAGEFYTIVLPWLRTVGAPDDVRLVFGFDS